MSSVTESERIAATREPDAPVVLLQDWHHLLFLHWKIAPQLLQAMVPPELTVDTFDGNAYVAVVPFTMTGVRPVLTPPLPWISAFHEVNVRTYVHREGKDPGVWFFSLDASSPIAVAAARAMYHLTYYRSGIEFSATTKGVPVIDFTSVRDDVVGPKPANGRFRYSPSDGIAAAATPGTLEFFLVERYFLYAADESRQLYRAQVHHQPYPLQKAEVFECDETLSWAAGIRHFGGQPLRHYAREVNVKVYPLERCR